MMLFQFPVAIDWQALALALLFLALLFALNRLKGCFASPTIFVSDLSTFASLRRTRRIYLVKLTRCLPYIAIGLLLIAFLNPRYYRDRNIGPDAEPPIDPRLSTEGIALYFVLDQSGSMSENVIVANSQGLPISQPKIELLRQLTMLFIEGDSKAALSGRGGDLIGLVEFARTAHLILPLTLDTQAVIEALKHFQVVKEKGDDGTAIGYAIYKTASLISATRHFARTQSDQGLPAYEIQSSAMILVTDGLQDPNPLDIGSRWRWIDPVAAAEYARDHAVKLYIVNIEPRLAAEAFKANRNQLQHAAEITGGRFFMASSERNLASIYGEIDKLEKSPLPLQFDWERARAQLPRDELPELYERFFLYPYLIALGLTCLGLWTLMETLFLRRLP